jgi:HSP20 family protein
MHARDEKLMKKSEEFDGEYQNGIEKISKIIEELMEEHMQEFEEKNGQKKPLIYGISMKIENGKKKVHEFGNLKSHEEREPLIDIIEDTKTITIIAEIPGVAKEAISIDLENENELTINVDDKNHKYKKALALPNKVSEDNVSASYKNGILEIIFQRKDETQKRIRPS